MLQTWREGIAPRVLLDPGVKHRTIAAITRHELGRLPRVRRRTRHCTVPTDRVQRACSAAEFLQAGSQREQGALGADETARLAQRKLRCRRAWGTMGDWSLRDLVATRETLGAAHVALQSTAGFRAGPGGGVSEIRARLSEQTDTLDLGHFIVP